MKTPKIKKRGTKIGMMIKQFKMKEQSGQTDVMRAKPKVAFGAAIDSARKPQNGPSVMSSSQTFKP